MATIGFLRGFGKGEKARAVTFQDSGKGGKSHTFSQKELYHLPVMVELR